MGHLHCDLDALPDREAIYRRTSEDEAGKFDGVGRIAAVSIPEEPGAGVPHAGICAGAVG